MLNGYEPEGYLYFDEGAEEDVYKVSEILMKQKYVVMLSKEEGATILSYINTYDRPEADRNGVAFMRYEDFEEIIFKDAALKQNCKTCSYHGTCHDCSSICKECALPCANCVDFDKWIEGDYYD